MGGGGGRVKKRRPLHLKQSFNGEADILWLGKAAVPLQKTTTKNVKDPAKAAVSRSADKSRNHKSYYTAVAKCCRSFFRGQPRRVVSIIKGLKHRPRQGLGPDSLGSGGGRGGGWGGMVGYG